MNISNAMVVLCVGTLSSIAHPSTETASSISPNRAGITSDTSCREPAGAIIEKIEGSVFLRRDSNGKARRLDPRVDAGRVLAVGCQVRSERDGVLHIHLSGKSKEIRASSSWYTIRALGPESPYRVVLEQYGRVGGRERGEQSVVFSPSPHSVVVPRDLVIRWNRGPALHNFSLRIKSAGGGEIWRQNNVAGESGLLASEPARQALSTYRAGGGEEPLILTLVDSDENETQLSFSLISRAGEKSVRKQLSEWDKEPVGLVSHLGRAAVFALGGIYPSVAEEYEAALTIAPESEDLLCATISAHRRIGNVERADELIKRLSVGTSVR